RLIPEGYDFDVVDSKGKDVTFLPLSEAIPPLTVKSKNKLTRSEKKRDPQRGVSARTNVGRRASAGAFQAVSGQRQRAQQEILKPVHPSRSQYVLLKVFTDISPQAHFLQAMLSLIVVITIPYIAANNWVDMSLEILGFWYGLLILSFPAVVFTYPDMFPLRPAKRDSLFPRWAPFLSGIIIGGQAIAVYAFSVNYGAFSGIGCILSLLVAGWSARELTFWYNSKYL
ncbi:MAG: hypothetical protein QW728_03680, partial [Thermoplasmata archaeon]